MGSSLTLFTRPASQVFFQSKIQEHDFGCPLQLSSLDSDHPSAFSDSAHQSSVETVQIRDQDLVLVCTDGVFDNVDMQVGQNAPCNMLSS